MRKRFFFILVLSLYFSFNILADELIFNDKYKEDLLINNYQIKEKEKLSLLQISGYFALIEGLFALNSLMADYAPMPYGIISIIISPLAISDHGTPITTAATLTLFIGLCSYNIFYPLYNDVDSYELFLKNYAGWHIITAGAAIGYMFDNIFTSDKNQK